MRRGITLVAALVALALPSAAAAAPRYVDAETGSDTDPTCPALAPCDTIAYAIANSAAGDEIFVDNGTYPESVTLGDGRSLTQGDFVGADGNGPAVVDGGGATAITVPASGAGHIRGLTIRSDAAAQVQLNGAAEVDSNGFDDPNADGTVVGVEVNVPGSTIHDNLFTDPAPGPTRGRVGVYSPSSPVTVRGNTFTGLLLAVQAGGPGADQTTLIEGNTITGTHQLPVAGRALLVGGTPGTVIVRENTISDPNTAIGSGLVDGIHPQGPVRLVRNEITEHNNGVFVGSNTTGVTLEGDRIWGNSFDGLQLFDSNGATGGQTSVTATNVTMWDNAGVDFRVQSSSLTLDSSIIDDFGWSGSASCAITFSRAFSDPDTDPSGCDDFQTTADPMFEDAATGDFHLQAGSPMLDLGNPADPGAGAVDFDGDPRAVDATPECTGNVARRDIGADEFVPAAIDCDPPDTTVDSGPANGESINDTTPTFTFSSDEAGTFECAVDGPPYGACSGVGEHTTDALGDGDHTFTVRAVDSAGNTDPDPVTRAFTVDTAAPDTTFTQTPPKKSKRKRVRFAFAAEDNATFECQLDSKPAFACDSPTRVKVKPGRHVFRVVATDEAGNVEATAAKFRFRRLKR